MTRTTRPHTVYATSLAACALLVAVAGGGTALAAGLAKDSVGSPQIKNGTVRSVDLRDGSVTGRDVNERSLGTVAAADTARQSDHAGTADEAAEAAHARTADEVAGSLRASVDATGELQVAQTVDAVSAEQTATPGRYVVTFDRSITDCLLVAGVAHNQTDRIVGFASAWVTPAAGNPTGTKVTVETHAPDVADSTPDPLPFSLVVSC